MEKKSLSTKTLILLRESAIVHLNELNKIQQTDEETTAKKYELKEMIGYFTRMLVEFEAEKEEPANIKYEFRP